MFATLNIGAMATFSLYVHLPPLLWAARLTICSMDRAIPETKGRSLEEMDIIFGTVSLEQRRADIAQQERGMCTALIICS